MTTYRVNVSSVQSFMQCRFRWWCEWVMNRVPIAQSPALDAGKLLHRIYERNFRDGTPLFIAAEIEANAYEKQIPGAHPSAQPGALKALQTIRDLKEAWPLWHDTFPVDEVLEVEEPFELADPELPGVLWIGRPDRVIRSGHWIWHVQNRGLAAGMNFGTYVRLALRHYHEHLYARSAHYKYVLPFPERGLKVGGVVFNLVRKLKYRTGVGTKAEKVKSAAEMFWQGPCPIGVTGPLHERVMYHMRYHVREMQRVKQEWEEYGAIPAPNEKMNGGFSGNSDDLFFRVLIGEIDLMDNNYFKPREDTYADVNNAE